MTNGTSSIPQKKLTLQILGHINKEVFI